MTDSRPFGVHMPQGFVRWAIERTRSLPNRWPARRLAFMLRRLAINALRGAPVDTEALGARMRLYPYNNICEKKVLFTPQFFDPQELAVLESRIGEGFTFVDVGANVGAYSLFVAAKVGELTLFLDPRNRGESSVKIVGPSQAGTVRVPAVTLLDLLRAEGFTRVDAMKLDVEGAEDLILDPFFRSAPASLHPAFFIIEDGRGQWQTNLPALLETKGYRLVCHTQLNLLYERKPVS